MVEKITCPECDFEFDIGEGYKKHLKDLETKTLAKAENKNKAAFEIRVKQESKKIREETEASVKAQKEKTDKSQKALQAEKEKNKKADKHYKEHYAAISENKMKAFVEDKEQKYSQREKKFQLKDARSQKIIEQLRQQMTQGVTVDQGSQQEMQLGEFLQKVFKSTEDKITSYGKGVPLDSISIIAMFFPIIFDPLQLSFVRNNQYQYFLIHQKVHQNLCLLNLYLQVLLLDFFDS